MQYEVRLWFAVMTYFYQFLVGIQTLKVSSQRNHDEILALQKNHPQSPRALVLSNPKTAKVWNFLWFSDGRKPLTCRTQQRTRPQKRDFQIMQQPQSLRSCSLQWPFNSLDLLVINISSLVYSVLIQVDLRPLKTRCWLEDFQQKFGS